MWPILRVLYFIAMIVAVVAGFAFLKAGTAEGRQLAQTIFWVALGPVVVSCGLLLVYHTSISIMQKMRNYRRYRQWGYVFGVIGFFLVAVSAGNDTGPNIYSFLLAGFGFLLVGLAWLINHFPPGRRQTRSR